MIGQTKGAAMKQSMGKALGTVKKHAATGAAILGGVGLAYVTHKLREHHLESLPGAGTHAGSDPRYSHRAPYIDPATGGLVRDGRHAPPGGIVHRNHAPTGGVWHDGGTRWTAS